MKVILTVDADFAGYDPLYGHRCTLDPDFFSDLQRTRELIAEETGNRAMLLIHTSPFVRREHRDLFYTEGRFLELWQEHVQAGGSLGQTGGAVHRQRNFYLSVDLAHPFKIQFWRSLVYAVGIAKGYGQHIDAGPLHKIRGLIRVGQMGLWALFSNDNGRPGNPAQFSLNTNTNSVRQLNHGSSLTNVFFVWQT